VVTTEKRIGPHITNELIREALHPYPDGLVIVTKIGARRGEDASWLPASSPAELTQAVHDNLRNLSLEALDVVNLRNMFDGETSMEPALTVLADLQRQGLVRHIGLSNVTPEQVAKGRRICPIVCVQNHYNVAHRADDPLIDELARDEIAYVPFFPLCPSPKVERLAGSVESRAWFARGSPMLTAVVLFLRTIGLMCAGHRAVALENLALRQQLAALKRAGRRAQLRMADRVFWILLAHAWRDWRKALVFVQPDTVVRWHRQWLRRRWAARSRPSRPGRPSTDVALRTLVAKMTAANPLWGAPRIHGELQKLGLEISERTVSRLLRRPRRPSQTWRTFFANHVAALVSMDFFTVPTITGRVLFVLVLVAHERRRIVHVGITEHPSASWTAQQLIEAFPDDTAPRWLVRDRDAIYSDGFRRRVAGMGITEVVCAPSSPWQNPYAERLIGSIRRECLDHLIVLNERHLRRLLTRYMVYYHGARTHLALAKDAPTPRRVQPPIEGPVISFPEVGGLHHRYERSAA
jgi:putative transposase